ncbi:hypothetical protein DM860_014263 [Cuscuta australis]|uniref:Pectinesterase inhibitor domain-containing protein n=1 Tax=Cuscuta australis TaxID=267555 RepID=A0A328DD30_9ASTE|nr:hypothetical protein DM860_014263 [Cuscuta australis]
MGSRFPVLQTILLFSTLAAAAAARPELSNDLVRKSCLNASYPEICYRTLSSYGGSAMKTPRDLAQAALQVSLGRAAKAAEFVRSVRGESGRERAALRDCVQEMGDAVEELRRSVAELKHLRKGAEFEWQMSNVETWVSAALTNEDTCLDGFKEVSAAVRSDVRRKIRNMAKVTSNALYLVNQLGSSPNKQ